MNTAANISPRLVGDIGGTNSRLALFDARENQLRHIHSYANRDYQCLEEIIQQWMNSLEEPPPTSCCLAVASPPFDDVVSMLNIGWSFSIENLARKFAFADFRCINDFEGNAFALPYLDANDRVDLRPNPAANCRKLAVVGPGTGLGGATLEFCLDTPVATASEPGHISLGPANAEELAVFGALLAENRDVYAELILSGPGLQRLHLTLGRIRGENTDALTPADILKMGTEGNCVLCRSTLKMFCALLGSFCGDYVLATGSYGGLFLAGGIVPRMVPFIQASDFQQRFDSKGEMTPYLAKVPLYAITSDTLGLVGAAHAPMAL